MIYRAKGECIDMLGRHNIFEDYGEVKSYVCPHCGAFAGMEAAWYRILNKGYGASFVSEQEARMDNIEYGQSFGIVTCRACNKIHFLLGDKMIYPNHSAIEDPNQDMPEDIKNLYNEARSVFELSSKAGAALLRLALQKLCKHLGGKGENINKDIGFLVEKGLSIEIQKALDSIRVIGNNGVHPGEIDLDEDKDLAASLFPIMNMIVDRMISEPKKVNEIYERLPETVRVQIDRRDKKD